MLLAEECVESVGRLFSSYLERTLAAAGEKFEQVVLGTAARFKARCLIACLLRNAVLNTLAQRALAYYLLSYAYSWTDVRAFPFLKVLVEQADSSPLVAERKLVQNILRDGPASVASLTPSDLSRHAEEERDGTVHPGSLRAQYGQGWDAESPVADARVASAMARVLLANGHEGDASGEFDLLRRQPDAAASPLPRAAALAFVARSTVTGSVATSTTTIAAAAAAVNAGPSRILGYAPPPCCPRPPLLPDLPSERGPRLPPLAGPLLWDSSAEVSAASLDRLGCILRDGFVKPLLPAQHRELLDALERWPRLVHYLPFSPAQLPALLEHNNMVAAELLLKLLDTASHRVAPFLDVLIAMEPAVQPLEVVKRLTAAPSLPSDFVPLYINSCIRACEAIEQKNQQNRPVRLVCVFLQSLIRTKVIDVTSVQYEVLSFCAKFSRIREAASLFRMLQTSLSQADMLTGGQAVDVQEAQ